MSFLGDLVGSIGTGKALPPSQPPKATNPTIARTNSPVQKPSPRPTANALAPGIKRKADDNVSSSVSKNIKPQASTPASAIVRKAAPPLNAPRPQPDKALINKPQSERLAKDVSTKPTSTSATPSLKPPPTKGSFAELMARAQAKGPQQNFGTIKHTKTAPREKLSRREQERRKEDSKVRTDKSGSGGLPKPDNRRSASPVKNGVQNGRVSKPAQSRPVYKGTMGLSGGREKSRQDGRSRRDEYLGTDEEDNSDIDDDDNEGDGYESSDMEGGFDDLEVEESAALRAAKMDDARELALDNQHKREKEERRRRLEALAKKRK